MGGGVVSVTSRVGKRAKRQFGRGSGFFGQDGLWRHRFAVLPATGTVPEALEKM
jgi:hypothetical protein